MYTFLLILLVLDAILMGVVVLLQAGQGGGLASLGGGTTDMVVGGRQAVTASCGICGALSIDAVRWPERRVVPTVPLDLAELVALPDRMREAQAVFERKQEDFNANGQSRIQDRLEGRVGHRAAASSID